MAFQPNSGGGRSPNYLLIDDDLLSKPYDVSGAFGADLLAQLNEMLEELYKANNRNVGRISEILATISTIQSQIAALQSASGSGGITEITMASGDAIVTVSSVGLYSVSYTLLSGDVNAGLDIPFITSNGWLTPISAIHVHEDSSTGGWVSTRTLAIKNTNDGANISGAVNYCAAGTSQSRYRIGVQSGGSTFASASPIGATLAWTFSNTNTGGASAFVVAKILLQLVSSI